MSWQRALLTTAVIVSVIFIHLYWSPYTKVEESFNTQAMHDIIFHGIPADNTTEYLQTHYDHTVFSGSVPRTFVGALVTAGISRPFVSFVGSAANVQLLARAVIGLFNAVSIVAFKSAVERLFGRSAGVWYLLLQVSQFHVMYYASRPLPNMFAFGISTLAFRSLLIGFSTPDRKAAFKQYRLCLYLMSVAGVIFRAELAVLLGSLTVYLLVRRLVSLKDVVIPAGIAGSLMGLLITVSVDSFFWQKFPIWPELTGFIYNTIEGHSSEWGVSPWYFYFANSLPKVLLNPLTYVVLIPLAVYSPATRQRSIDLLVPALGFISIYSILPHKEWRFIVYIVPTMTAVASAGASWIWTRRSRTSIYWLSSAVLAGSIFASLAISTSMLAISSLNYPGALAINRLHEVAMADGPVIRVHLDNLSCQNGVTRFLQKRSGVTNQGTAMHPHKTMEIEQAIWIYDKTGDESTLLDPAFWLQFDYVLAERQEKVIGKWEVVDTVDGFAGFRLLGEGDVLTACTTHDGFCQRWRSLATFVRSKLTRGRWLDLKMEPKIHILRRQES